MFNLGIASYEILSERQGYVTEEGYEVTRYSDSATLSFENGEEAYFTMSDATGEDVWTVWVDNEPLLS